jgi:small subunit ribosomal protein S15
MLTKKTKDKIIKKFQQNEKDTGSPEVQVAVLSQEIDELSKHLLTHKKDDSSRKGLVGKVGQRRKLLGYLQKKDDKRYAKVIKDLGMKK